MKLGYCIKDLQEYAQNRGGKVLSKEYLGCYSPIIWECSNKHTWEAKWAHIKHNNSWCRECFIVHNKQSIETIKVFAKTKNWSLLTESYISNKQKLTWLCEYNHTWVACWDSIKNSNSTCPSCKQLLKTELCVKSLLENKLNITFNKKRFYYNKRKFYELDGYNEEYKIAFEYNGRQHYIRHPKWHKTEQEFIN